MVEPTFFMVKPTILMVEPTILMVEPAMLMVEPKWCVEYIYPEPLMSYPGPGVCFPTCPSRAAWAAGNGPTHTHVHNHTRTHTPTPPPPHTLPRTFQSAELYILV